MDVFFAAFVSLFVRLCACAFIIASSVPTAHFASVVLFQCAFTCAPVLIYIFSNEQINKQTNRTATAEGEKKSQFIQIAVCCLCYETTSNDSHHNIPSFCFHLFFQLVVFIFIFEKKKKKKITEYLCMYK